MHQSRGERITNIIWRNPRIKWQGDHGTGNLVTIFSRQGKHWKFKEFNKNIGNLDMAGKLNHF